MPELLLHKNRHRTSLTNYSGIIPLPIYTKPYPCEGKCIYCPKDKNLPQSYIANEDTIFAEQCNYSPNKQVDRFINRYPPVKLLNMPFEIIILGGSFSSLNSRYRTEYFKQLYNHLAGLNSKEEHPLQWEKSAYRSSVLTVESRPDQITNKEAKYMRKIGVSKVEIGVQHTNDKILDFIQRGHTQTEIKAATKILKEEGFKVGYHIMVGLPGSKLQDDLEMLESTLWNRDYSPDYLKIYPCTLLKDRSRQPLLYDLYTSKKWEPINHNNLKVLLTTLWNNIPPYIRISRIHRIFNPDDIQASTLSKFGRYNHSNCMCIRCKEIGRKFPFSTLDEREIDFHEYKNGKDIFIISKDAENNVYGIIRFLENKNSLIIRELKVFGLATRIGSKGNIQGQGVGKKLISKVEKVARNKRMKFVLINAAYGARLYFKKLGYNLNTNDFLEKIISSHHKN